MEILMGVLALVGSFTVVASVMFTVYLWWDSHVTRPIQGVGAAALDAARSGDRHLASSLNALFDVADGLVGRADEEGKLEEIRHANLEDRLDEIRAQVRALEERGSE